MATSSKECYFHIILTSATAFSGNFWKQPDVFYIHEVFDTVNSFMQQFSQLYYVQKQPPRGVPRKRCSENMQQIYRRTPMPKCDFNKVALQCYVLLLNRYSFTFFLYQKRFQENCPRGKLPLALILTLILNQTLTLTGGQFSEHHQKHRHV